MKRKWSELMVNVFWNMGKTEIKNRLESFKMLKKPVRYINALYQVGISLSNPDPWSSPNILQEASSQESMDSQAVEDEFLTALSNKTFGDSITITLI